MNVNDQETGSLTSSHSHALSSDAHAQSQPLTSTTSSSSPTACSPASHILSATDEILFFRYMRTDAMLRLLYTVCPNDARVIYLRRRTAAQLAPFWKFSNIHRLDANNASELRSIDDVHQCVDRMKLVMRSVMHSTQHLVMVAHRLLRAVRTCQRFVRGRLGKRQCLKERLLREWSAAENTARTSLDAEINRRAKALKSVAASDVVKGMRRLYFDCWVSEEHKAEAILHCIAERRRTYRATFRAWKEDTVTELHRVGTPEYTFARELHRRVGAYDVLHLESGPRAVTITELCAHHHLRLIRVAMAPVSSSGTAEATHLSSSMPSLVGDPAQLPRPVSYYHALLILPAATHLPVLMALRDIHTGESTPLPPMPPTQQRRDRKKATTIARAWHLLPGPKWFAGRGPHDPLRTSARGSDDAVRAPQPRPELMVASGQSREFLIPKRDDSAASPDDVSSSCPANSRSVAAPPHQRRPQSASPRQPARRPLPQTSAKTSLQRVDSTTADNDGAVAAEEALMASLRHTRSMRQYKPPAYVLNAAHRQNAASAVNLHKTAKDRRPASASQPPAGTSGRASSSLALSPFTPRLQSWQRLQSDPRKACSPEPLEGIHLFSSIRSLSASASALGPMLLSQLDDSARAPHSPPPRRGMESPHPPRTPRPSSAATQETRGRSTPQFVSYKTPTRAEMLTSIDDYLSHSRTSSDV